jgi:hypothetical protein
MAPIHAYAAKAPKGPLQPIEFEPGELGQDQVEIKITTYPSTLSTVILKSG